MKKIGVIGAGSWGTALANTLANKGHQVKIWDINQDHLKSMEEFRENKAFLPEIRLHDNITISYTIEETLKDGISACFLFQPSTSVKL